MVGAGKGLTRNTHPVRLSGGVGGAASDSANSESFSGSGKKGPAGGGSAKAMKSVKSNHTIEKTYSDFFNLTQESGIDNLLLSGTIST
jgi:hypothetical protein